MKKVVVDTSIIIDYTRASKGSFMKLIKQSSSQKRKVYIPTVVILELWAGESVIDFEEEKKLERLIQPFKLIGLTKQIAKNADVLIRKGEMESDFIDSVIASTALYLNAELATQNVKHFKNVNGLKLFKA